MKAIHQPAKAVQSLVLGNFFFTALQTMNCSNPLEIAIDSDSRTQHAFIEFGFWVACPNHAEAVQGCNPFREINPQGMQRPAGTVGGVDLSRSSHRNNFYPLPSLIVLSALAILRG